MVKNQTLGALAGHYEALGSTLGELRRPGRLSRETGPDMFYNAHSGCSVEKRLCGDMIIESRFFKNL